MSLPDEPAMPEGIAQASATIHNSTQIGKKVTAIVGHMSNASAEYGRVFSLKAHAPVANKLVSILEVAKRELTRLKIQSYQYTALTSEMVVIKSATHVPEEDDGDDEPAFEPLVSADKKRSIPIMTVHLSTIPLKGFRHAYGYVSLRADVEH